MEEMRPASLLFAGVLSMTSLVLAASDNPWPSFESPAPGPPRAIGEYSSGCLQGAHTLALDGLGYQVMHPSRKRYYGHPNLVAFIKALGRGVKRQGLGVVLVGDLSQPRGGRAPGGHSSHQSGLDVDVWYWHPKKASNKLLSLDEREQIASRSILNGKTGSIRPEWAHKVSAVLRLSAEDERVERVFVHPIIKRELCASVTGERAFLRKIRPWYGHDDHFHARLACPKDSVLCKPQPPIDEGDGCDQLAFWFDEAAQAARREQQREYQRHVSEGRSSPEACKALLR